MKPFPASLWIGGALVVTHVFAAVSNFNESFDSTIVGTSPAHWKTGGGGFAVATNELAQSSPNTLLLCNTNVGAAAYAMRALTPKIEAADTEVVEVSCRIRFAQTDASISAMLTDASTAHLLRINFNNIGQITATSGKEEIKIGSYEANTWHLVRIRLTPAKNEYDLEVSVGNHPVASRKGLPVNGPGKDIVYFYLQNYGRKAGPASAYVDDVAVSWPQD